MFNHVSLRVDDVAAAKHLYGAALAAMGLELTGDGETTAFWGDHFAISAARDDRPATQAAHIAFDASGPEAVDAFHAAGLAAGFDDGGAPGPRPQIAEGYYAAFLVDGAGNRIEAVHRS